MSSAITCSWLMKLPRSSMMPTRSASPSLAMQRSKPPLRIRSIACGIHWAMGSGCIPPKPGFRSPWISSTVVLPPERSART